MDAETMIERLTRAQSYITTKPTIADAAMLHIAEVIAALRAQAKAEPVAWETDRGLSRYKAVAFACGAQYAWPLYRSPPPDHAKALAEEVERMLRRWQREAIEATNKDMAGALHYCAHSLLPALTRYKERTNGCP